MEPDPAAEEALETLYRPRGLRVADLSFETDGTLVASERHAGSSRARARGVVPARTPDAPDEREIELGRELGRGGMGAVYAASQRSLRREVAVKRALDPGTGSADLVEEGWALAHLAHPSVVPVHAIAYLDGVPALVMKRVSGTPWSEVLARPDAHTGLLESDALGFHLRTLVEVTRAVEHAHDAGVLHLDLKPQNVMIGEFGEVYVLDWGLCARTKDEPAWLAPAASIGAVAGTPEYMAPELAMAAGERIGERTDVYLLGAILHEILTGTPRHAGRNPIQRLYHACLSAPPPQDPRVPAALAELVRRATAREPADRPASAAAFRQEVEAYLRDREADALLARAEEEARALEAALATAPVDRGEVHARFGGARFAAREARSLRPELERAAAIEQRLHTAMARFALEAGEIALAESYLAALPEGDAALSRAIDAARTSAAARAAHVERLEGLARDEDLETGRALRSSVTFTLASLFFLWHFGMVWLEGAGVYEFGYRDVFGFAGVLAVVVGPWAWMRRRQLFPNRAGSTIWALVLTMLAVVQGHWALGAALDVPFRTIVALTPTLYTLCFGAMASLIDPRLWPAAAIQAATALVAAAVPEHTYAVVGVGGTASGYAIGLSWRVREDAVRRAASAAERAR